MTYEDILSAVTELNFSVNPLTNLRLPYKLLDDEDLTTLLSSEGRSDIYELYPKDFKYLTHTVMMSARSLKLALDSDLIINRLMTKQRLESPEIWIDIPEKDPFEWVTESELAEQEVFIKVMMECYTSEWIIKLKDLTLKEYYQQFYGDNYKIGPFVELTEAILYTYFTSSSTKLVRDSVTTLLASRYSLYSLLKQEEKLFDLKSEDILSLGLESFISGLTESLYSDLIELVPDTDF